MVFPAILTMGVNSLIYPFYALKVGRIAGSSNNPYGSFIYLKDEKISFWYYFIGWIFLGILSTIAALAGFIFFI